MTIDTNESRHVYTVSELNQDVRTLLETGFPALWLEGEISNFTAPSSGHWYFTLKDKKAQVRCAMFKNRSRVVNFTPKQGDKVLIRAKISLYEARGDYQLIAESMEEAGFGALQRQFEELKNKLQSEGLFSSSVKQALPEIPKQIGVITSPTGAAIKDILNVLKRRFPAIPVLIYPTLVQGELAAPQIAQMIDRANRHKTCDVLILTRGGGSLEDLWAFNEEIVARAIFQSNIPIVSGVGHDIDVTISDFVADKHAPTPSAAAELITPDVKDFLLTLSSQQKKLQNLANQSIKHKQTQLTLIGKRLKHPHQQLMEHAQKLDSLELRLVNSVKRNLEYKSSELKQKTRLFQTASPLKKIIELKKSILDRQLMLFAHAKQNINNKKNRLALSVQTLNAISPLATLDRGYSIVSHRNNNCIVTSHNEVELNEELDIKLSHGKLVCIVKESSAD